MFEIMGMPWYIFIAIFAIGWIFGSLVLEFLKLPTTDQIAKVKEWLVWAVAAAEKELGSGTGQLKLRYVYGMFTQTWPTLAKMISFEKFSSFVDEALVRFQNMLQTNKNINTYIEGEKDA